VGYVRSFLLGVWDSKTPQMVGAIQRIIKLRNCALILYTTARSGLFSFIHNAH